MDPRGIQSPPLLHVWALLLFFSTFSCQHFDRFSGALLLHYQCFSTRFRVAIFTLAHQFTCLTKSRQWMVYQWRVQGTIEIVVMSCWKCFYIYFLNFIFVYIKIRKKTLKKWFEIKQLMFLKIFFHCKNKKKSRLLHNLFWFIFYEVVSILWLRSYVLWLNSGRLKLFYCIFFRLIFLKKKINLQQWIYWKLGFIICFDLLYVKLSLFHDICRGFDKVTRVELSYFFYLLSIRLSRSYNLNYEFDRLTQVIFLIIFFNFIFNIGLIENWTL